MAKRRKQYNTSSVSAPPTQGPQVSVSASNGRDHNRDLFPNAVGLASLAGLSLHGHGHHGDIHSSLLERTRLARRHGLSYDDDRDLYLACGYPEELTTADYRSSYERGDIAARIVEALPKATWPGGITVRQTEDVTVETEFEVATRLLFKRLGLLSRTLRADILAGLGRYSILFIGAPGNVKDPLESVQADDLLYVSPLGENRATIKTLVEDTQDPRFGLPLVYTLNLSKLKPHEEVHASRVIHVADGLLDDELFGRPTLKRVFNRLQDLDKLIGGGAEAAWQRMNPGGQIDIDPEAELSADDEKQMTLELDEWQHNIRRWIRTQGTKITPMVAAVTTFSGNVDTVIDVIAAAIETPKCILMGSERGELASSQDEKNWTKRVLERWLKFGEPLVRQAVDKFIELGALPEPGEEGYEVVRPPSDELEEEARSAVAVGYARANESQERSGASPILSSSEIRDRVFGLEPLEETRPQEGTDTSDTSDLSRLEGDLHRCNGDIVDTPHPSIEWQTIHQVSDDHRNMFELVMGALWTLEQTELAGREDALVTAIEAVDESQVIAALDLPDDERDAQLDTLLTVPLTLVGIAIDAADELSMDGVTFQYTDTATDAGERTAQTVVSRGSFVGLTELKRGGAASKPRRLEHLDLEFNSTNPRAVTWAQLQSSTLITEVSQLTKAGMRDVIANGIATGVAPRPNVRNVIELVGLRSDQLRTLRAFELDGATPAQVSRRAATMLRQRGLLIARTETMNASRFGQQELWLQARDDGLLPSNIKRKWLATPDGRTRPDHVAMRSHKLVGLDEPFTLPSGRTLMNPDEPNCRCGVGLVEVDVN